MVRVSRSGTPEEQFLSMDFQIPTDHSEAFVIATDDGIMIHTDEAKGHNLVFTLDTGRKRRPTNNR